MKVDLLAVAIAGEVEGLMVEAEPLAIKTRGKAKRSMVAGAGMISRSTSSSSRMGPVNVPRRSVILPSRGKKRCFMARRFTSWVSVDTVSLLSSGMRKRGCCWLFGTTTATPYCSITVMLLLRSFVAWHLSQQSR